MKYVYKSFMGYIYYILENNQLTSMYISDVDEGIKEENIAVNQELKAYFEGTKHTFDIPVLFNHGTKFQQDVWYAMLDIPFGQTRSYLDIAKSIDRPKAVRAVGQACKRNPIGIVVPCHRVIGSDGSLTGYSGKNFIHVKQKLLEHERRFV
ncbi:MAG: methylated-DNA--[protein]-cysteine S-methyltransferase [Bacillota bacterium]|nr:MAG: methylated-DNA--[protein]-cysteine S-methyltransferase [Bacillota bacterium]